MIVVNGKRHKLNTIFLLNMEKIGNVLKKNIPERNFKKSYQIIDTRIYEYMPH